MPRIAPRKTKQISIKIPQDTLQDFDAHCLRLGFNRSNRLLFLMGMDLRTPYRSEKPAKEQAHA